MKQLIKDPYFQCLIDLNSSSPHPIDSIWAAQHVCVSEGFAPNDLIPESAADAIIKHQLKHGHWSVLNFAYVKLDFAGFPHDTAMQMARHQGSFPLVQSLRYTGERFREAMDNPELIKSLFYCPPVGEYFSREGGYEISAEYRKHYYKMALESASNYDRQIFYGIPEEVARRSLLAGYRQNFTLAGTIRDVFHWLDQRTLADTQIECQTLAWMALDELEKWEPELFGWYRKNRAGKNNLAP